MKVIPYRLCASIFNLMLTFISRSSTAISWNTSQNSSSSNSIVSSISSFTSVTLKLQYVNTNMWIQTRWVHWPAQPGSTRGDWSTADSEMAHQTPSSWIYFNCELNVNCTSTWKFTVCCTREHRHIQSRPLVLLFVLFCFVYIVFLAFLWITSVTEWRPHDRQCTIHPLYIHKQWLIQTVQLPLFAFIFTDNLSN